MNDAFVSCLMVTQSLERRLPYLKSSIADYCRQAHLHRELVLVLERVEPDAHEAIRAHVDALGRDDIRVIDPPSGQTVGALRNISWAEAKGDVLCQWDDDDRYHPDRIAAELLALYESNTAAVCLQDVMQFFPHERLLYCTNWRATEVTAHPGTLMCRSDIALRYAERGEFAQLGEDTALLRALRTEGGMHALSGQPHLYIYVSHGANAWHDGHHRMLADKLSLSKALLKRREAELREGLSVFDFGEQVTVQGSNGPAFVIDHKGRTEILSR
jgi:glycosyltransferase involved in cell wall biosynthesis